MRRYIRSDRETAKIKRIQAEKRKAAKEERKLRPTSRKPVCPKPSFPGSFKGHTIYTENGFEPVSVRREDPETGEDIFFKVNRRVIHQVWVWNGKKWIYDYRPAKA